MAQATSKESIANHPSRYRSLHVSCTADHVGSGNNEELVGTRHQRPPAEMCWPPIRHVRGPNGEFLGVKARRTTLKQACDASLKRRAGRDRPLLSASRR